MRVCIPVFGLFFYLCVSICVFAFALNWMHTPVSDLIMNAQDFIPPLLKKFLLKQILFRYNFCIDR